MTTVAGTREALSDIAIESAMVLLSEGIVSWLRTAPVESTAGMAVGAGGTGGVAVWVVDWVRAAMATATRAPMPTTVDTRETRRERSCGGVMKWVRVEVEELPW